MAGYVFRSHIVDLAAGASSLEAQCVPMQLLLDLFASSRWLCTAWHNVAISTVCSDVKRCMEVGEYLFQRAKETYYQFRHHAAALNDRPAHLEWHGVLQLAQGFVERQMADLVDMDGLDRQQIRRHLCGPIGIGTPVLDVNRESRDRWLELARTHLRTQMLVDGVGMLDGATGSSGRQRLAFAFLTYSSLAHEEAWEHFFAAAPDDRHAVWIHSLTGQAPRQSQFRSRARLLQSATQSAWCGIGELMLELMAAVLQDADVGAVVWLAQDTVPLRPFAEVYDWALSDGRSALCMNGGTGCADTWSVMQRRHMEVFAFYRHEFVEMFDGIATCQEECWFSLGLLLADPQGLRDECGTYACWGRSKPLSARMDSRVPSMAGLNTRPEEDCGGPQEFRHLLDSDFDALLSSGFCFARKFHEQAELIPSRRGLQEALSDHLARRSGKPP
mmetsp:Transcript_118486/g.377691  ORF Transcript_118486/g.377691 Transcript_118486/m.377691 type:complete len:444 (+) Transcript_118486:114-1445(+)